MMLALAKSLMTDFISPKVKTFENILTTISIQQEQLTPCNKTLLQRWRSLNQNSEMYNETFSPSSSPIILLFPGRISFADDE